MERNIQGNNFASTVVFTAALATVFAIAALRFIPFSPAMPESNLDTPWVLAMNQAVSAHLVFGRDVVFTLGRYATVFTRNYHPSTDKMTMFGSTTIDKLLHCVVL
jgi:hypothetical protein